MFRWLLWKCIQSAVNSFRILKQRVCLILEAYEDGARLVRQRHTCLFGSSSVTHFTSGAIVLHTSIWSHNVLNGCRNVTHLCTQSDSFCHPGYDSKQSDGEAPLIVELWGMQSTPSLPSLPGLIWPGFVAPDRVLSVGQIEQFDI